MTKRHRGRVPHRAIRTTPAPLSGAEPLDEAAAILADLDGPRGLRRARLAARGNPSGVPSVAANMQRNHLGSRVLGIAPHLGIFWAIADATGQPHLLAHLCPLPDAEPYGDCLTCLAGHHQVWERWRRGRPKPPLPQLAPLIARGEYEDWPRGRIVYECAPDRFVIYADHQLLTSLWLAQIIGHFHLPPKRTTARSDLHYRSKRAISPP